MSNQRIRAGFGFFSLAALLLIFTACSNQSGNQGDDPGASGEAELHFLYTSNVYGEIEPCG